jgi:GNAT superfamily N-acetyltransferase
LTTAIETRLRPLQAADRGRIESISRAVGVFRNDEIQIALEVFDASCRPGQTDYLTLGAESNGQLSGWICWGRTPCTLGTFDLYWMAVDPSTQGSGVGTALIDKMERELPPDARLVMIDTSGRPDYAPTRAFYVAKGYQIVAVVPDFYAPGDDQVILQKAIGG